MLVIFAVVTTLVVLIPVAWRDRIDWTGPIRLKFYLAFVVVSVAMLPWALGQAVLAKHWAGRILEVIGILLGLVSAGLLAMTVLEHARTFQVNLTEDKPSTTDREAIVHDHDTDESQPQDETDDTPEGDPTEDDDQEESDQP